MTRDMFGHESAPTTDLVIPDAIDIDVVIHNGTHDGIRVSRNGKDGHTAWLARSQIRLVHKPAFAEVQRADGRIVQMGTAVITLPKSMAKEKGLV